MMLWRMGLAAALVTALVRPPATTSAFTTKVSAALGRTAAVSTLYSSSSGGRPSQNPPSFSSLIGDMASSLLGKTPDRNPALDAQLNQVEPSWQAVRAQLESQFATDDERNFRANLAQGYGVASPLHKLRLYDESNQEEDIRVVFYRFVAKENCVLCISFILLTRLGYYIF